jgi:hypothetical protein
MDTLMMENQNTVKFINLFTFNSKLIYKYIKNIIYLGHSHGPSKKKEEAQINIKTHEENVNMKAAMIHVIGL